MQVNAARLQEFAPRISAPVLNAIAAALETAMPQFGIDTPLLVAHFMAQAHHESSGFTRFIENLHYTDPERLDDMFLQVRGIEDAKALIAMGQEAIANRVYARRNGNGSEASGDGHRFIGRGLFQLTGRDSYARAAKDLGAPYLDQPDLVAQPEGAVLTALWFWKANRCGAAAADDDVGRVTIIINGPRMVGLEERVALLSRAKMIFT